MRIGLPLEQTGIIPFFVCSKGVKMTKKETRDKMSSLAAAILSGRKEPTKTDTKKLAASVLSQDETKGKRK